MNYRIAVLIIPLLMGSCSQNTCAHDNKKLSIDCNGNAISENISSEDIFNLKQQALWGSVKASDTLVHIYGSDKYYNFKESFYWLNIAAENGSPEAMFFLSDNLRRKNNLLSVLRAKFWAEQAKKKGSHNADYTLSIISKDLQNYDANKGISPIERKALLGSAKAAITLANRASAHKDHSKELYWTHIAVQNGDRKAMRHLGILMQNDSDSQNQIRAQYWLNLANEDSNETPKS